MKKIRTVKLKKCKECGKEFKPYRTTDKYCSPQCANKNRKPQKPQKRIKPVSNKLKREQYLYSKNRKTFLKKPENRFCPVATMHLKRDDLTPKEREYWLLNQLAHEVHHKAGRKGKLLNHVPLWLAVGRAGHEWIHANPAKAYELGFSVPPSTVNI